MLLGNGEVRRLLRAEVQLKNAKVYLRTGQPEKGLMLLNRSLAANPDSPESWYTRGLANFKLE
ncbi:MAG: tetratricopeptide repeat protein, partial [bacterium]